MPFLPLEPFIFPENLFTNSPAGEHRNGQWWVVQTRPRAEKMLGRKLLSHGVSFFLPLQEKQRLVRRRTFTSYLPLFPSYVFLFGDNESRIRALETNCVINTLNVYEQKQLEGDLRQVYHLMESGESLGHEPELQPGALVEITQGVLAGLKGKIIKQHKKTKFLVEVHFLQQGVSVEIDNSMLTQIKERNLIDQ